MCLKTGAPLGTPVLSFMDCFGTAAPRNDVRGEDGGSILR